MSKGKRFIAVIATAAALMLVFAGPALAGKPSGGGGGGGKKGGGGSTSGGSSGLVLKDLTRTDNIPHWGDQITFTVTQGTHPLYDSAHAQFPGTVTISIGGKVAETFTADASTPTVWSDSFYYAPASTGTNVSVTATVTDSVLYSGNDSKTMDTAAAPSPPAH